MCAECLSTGLQHLFELAHSGAMFWRNAFLEKHATIPKERRLRENVADLMLSGEVSAKRARLLFEDAHVAGTSCVKDLATTRDS